MMTIRDQYSSALPQAQRGVATLLITLVILTTITFVLIYSARTVLMETKITANDLRGRQAFEAAEAGQEAAIAYISTAGGRDKDGTNSPDVIFNPDVDGVGTTDTLTLANGSQVTVTMSDASVPPLTATQVVATGWSDDRSATRTVTQVYAYVSPLPNVPANPLLTRGTVVVNGSAEVINPEGHSTIWSGGPVDLSGNATTKTKIADPSQIGGTNPYPDCLGSSTLDGSTQCEVVQSTDRTIAGLDVIEQDTSLSNLSSDEFFLNFFGATPLSYKENNVTISTTPALSTQNSPVGAKLAVDEVVWVDGGGPGGTLTNWNGLSAGCSVAGASNAAGMTCAGQIQPTIIIVDGDLRVTGNITIWGLLYVTGQITGAGSVDLTGAMMMQGSNASMTGNLRIIYNSSVLRSMADNGPLGGGGGSWRDF